MLARFSESLHQFIHKEMRVHSRLFHSAVQHTVPFNIILFSSRLCSFLLSSHVDIDNNEICKEDKCKSGFAAQGG